MAWVILLIGALTYPLTRELTGNLVSPININVLLSPTKRLANFFMYDSVAMYFCNFSDFTGHLDSTRCKLIRCFSSNLQKLWKSNDFELITFAICSNSIQFFIDPSVEFLTSAHLSGFHRSESFSNFENKVEFRDKKKLCAKTA